VPGADIVCPVKPVEDVGQGLGWNADPVILNGEAAKDSRTATDSLICPPAGV
jgi:hypothetical protein